MKHKMLLIAGKMKKLEEMQEDDGADAAEVENATEELAAMEVCVEGTEVLVVSEHAGKVYLGRVQRWWRWKAVKPC